MSLLKQDIIRKGRVDENATKLDVGDNNNGEDEVEII